MQVSGIGEKVLSFEPFVFEKEGVTQLFAAKVESEMKNRLSPCQKQMETAFYSVVFMESLRQIF